MPQRSHLTLEGLESPGCPHILQELITEPSLSHKWAFLLHGSFGTIAVSRRSRQQGCLYIHTNYLAAVDILSPPK